MGVGHIKKRRRSRRFVVVRRSQWLVIFALAGFSVWFALPHNREAAPKRPFSSDGSGASVSTRLLSSTGDVPPPIAHRERPARVVYPYSVIPGGIKSVEELKNAIAKDPVVSAHYATFHLSRARIIRLDRERSIHVSYRLGDHVYWTKRKLKLAKGETLITDGVHTARTRCGNLISSTVLPPVFPSEPTVREMDTPQDPRETDFQIGSGPQPGPPVTQTPGSGGPPVENGSPPPGNGDGPIIFGPPGPPASSPTPPTPIPVGVPEPTTPVLLLTGLFALVLLRRRGVQRLRHRVE
jgi:hypothetical protein